MRMRWTLMMASVAVLATATVTDAAEAAGEARVQRLEEYNTRRLETLRKIADDKEYRSGKNLGRRISAVTAMLYLEQEVEQANRIIMELNFKDLYWSSRNSLIPLFLMFNADTGSRKKLLTREVTDKILDYLWSGFTEPERKFFRKPYHVLPDQPWNFQGNMNHGFVFQTLYYFSADILKDYPKYNDQFDATIHIKLGRGVESLKGRPELAKMTLADYVDRHSELWRNRLLWMSKQGLWSEEMLYGNMCVSFTYSLLNHAPDPVVRQRARMLLDVHWIMVGLQMVDGVRGGAQNRYKAHHDGYHPERTIGWHYFGGRQGRPGIPMNPLCGDYLPPELAYDIWANPEKRGSFVYRERLNQFSPEVGQPPYVYKYNYVTPEYVLGSYIGHIMDEDGKYLTDHKGRAMGNYHERSMVGITLGKARSILRLGPILSFQSYHCMQNGPILLARWYGRETKGGQHQAKGEHDSYAQILSRKDGGMPIDPPVEEGGWVFVKAADAYFALRPARGKCTVKAEELRFDWPETKLPIVIHCGGEADDGSFDEFKRKVLANTLSYKDDLLTYTDPTWGKMEFDADPAKPNDQWRRINGHPVPLPDKLFDSPYLTSDYNTGVIEATFNGRKLVFDFNQSGTSE